MSTSTPSFKDQFRAVRKLMLKGLISGALIGIGCLIVALLDQKGTFTEFITDNMTNMPLTVVLAGIVGGFGFVLQKEKTGLLATAGKAWLDLIQQFFSLGTGAFWFIQVAVWARHEFMGAKASFELGPALTLFLTTAIMAAITSALDVAGTAPVTKTNRIVGTAECVLALVLLIGLLRFFDGEAIKCAAGAEISRMITGELKACSSFKLPTVARSTERTSDNAGTVQH